VPPKLRDLVAELEKAGFVNRGGKGSHRNFAHRACKRPVTISGSLGDDAKPYQVRAVRAAVQEIRQSDERQR
jgi:predicted RNA binding protein YcfA (HicA-like mRNA interferase family)